MHQYLGNVHVSHTRGLAVVVLPRALDGHLIGSHPWIFSLVYVALLWYTNCTWASVYTISIILLFAWKYNTECCCYSLPLNHFVTCK